MKGKLSTTALLLSALAAQALSQVSAVNGTLTVTTGPGDEAFFVRIGAEPGTVTLEGIPDLPDTIYTDIEAIVIDTGAGSDKVYVVQEGAYLPSLNVNTGLGEGLLELDMRVAASLTPLVSTVRYQGNSSNDVFLARVENQADDLRFDWAVSAGAGENESLAQIISDVPGARLGLGFRKNSGLNKDRVQIELEARAARIETNFGGNLGGGDDEFLVVAKGNGSSQAFAASSISLGIGDDKALIEFVEMGRTTLSGFVNGGEGGDIIEGVFGGPLFGLGTFDGGNGADTLRLYVNGNIAGSPRLLAGDGNDLVEMLGTSATGTPFSNGGPGFDFFKGIGQRINFEVIN